MCPKLPTTYIILYVCYPPVLLVNTCLHVYDINKVYVWEKKRTRQAKKEKKKNKCVSFKYCRVLSLRLLWDIRIYTDTNLSPFLTRSYSHTFSSAINVIRTFKMLILLCGLFFCFGQGGCVYSLFYFDFFFLFVYFKFYYIF